MSNALQIRKVKDLLFMEDQNNHPTFVWNGATYNFLPSISQFERELTEGGFKIIKYLTATIRLYDVDADDNLVPIFTNGTPTAQQKFVYSLTNEQFRIKDVRFEKAAAYIRITAVSDSRA